MRPRAEWKATGEGLVFLFPRRGDAEYVCRKRRERFFAGDVLIFRAAEGGRVCVAERELVFLSFSLCLENLYPLFAAKELPFLRQVVAGLQIARRFPAETPEAAECHRLLGELPVRANLAQRSHLLRIAAVVLAEDFNHAEPKPGGFVRADEHFIQVLDQLSSEELVTLSVGELACRFGCSRRHLNRLFHEFLGFSAAALRQELRLVKAATLLRDPEAKVINVAGDCGFTHLGFFNTCFKRRFGSNPSEWRRLASRKEMARAMGSGGATARALQTTYRDRARREGNGDGVDLRFSPVLKMHVSKNCQEVSFAPTTRPLNPRGLQL